MLTLWQTFVGGIVAFRVLPRPQFSALQNKIFPIYFGLQSALPVALALTFPGRLGSPGSLSGVLLEENRFTVLLPISLTLVSGLTNLLYLTPLVRETMKQRSHQGESLCFSAW